MALPRVVLVGVQLPENLGAAARAMANFGLHDLWLVAPEARPDHPQAVAMATHGAHVLAGARIVDSLPQALADVAWAWGTAALPRGREASAWHPRALAGHLAATPGAHALVFGPERTGLSAEDCARLHGVIHIPTAPECRALNLAQAVAVVCWEVSAAASGGVAGGHPRPMNTADAPAPVAAFDAMFDTFTQAILTSGWMSGPALREGAMLTLRQALQRARLNAGEVGALHGAIRAIAGLRKRTTSAG